MTFLTRLLRGGNTATTNSYQTTDAPHMPCNSNTAISAGRMTFRPTAVTVHYRNGRFQQMEISGPTDGHPNYNIIRRFNKERDVPDWVRRYLGEDI